MKTDLFKLLTSLVVAVLCSVNVYAEYSCLKLERIEFGDGVESIGAWAFSDCDNLKNVTFGKALKSIGDYAFALSTVSHIDFPSELVSIGEYGFVNCCLEGTLVLPDKLSELGAACFAGNMIEKIVLPASLDSLPDRVFQGNPLLCFPKFSNVRNISAAAFAYTAPSELILPGNVKRLGSGTFKECGNLSDVVIADADDTLDCRLVGEYDSYFSPFYNSPVENLYIGRDVTGKLFDQNPSLRYLTLGPKVSTLTDLDCTLFTGLRLLESKALTPPAMNEFTAGQYADVEVVVPEEALEAYKAAPVWKNFLKLNTSTAIDDIAADGAEVTVRSYYDLQGRPVVNPETGVFICHETLSDGRTVVRKVILR